MPICCRSADAALTHESTDACYSSASVVVQRCVSSATAVVRADAAYSSDIQSLCSPQRQRVSISRNIFSPAVFSTRISTFSLSFQYKSSANSIQNADRFNTNRLMICIETLGKVNFLDIVLKKRTPIRMSVGVLNLCSLCITIQTVRAASYLLVYSDSLELSASVSQKQMPVPFCTFSLEKG